MDAISCLTDEYVRNNLQSICYSLGLNHNEVERSAVKRLGNLMPCLKHRDAWVISTIKGEIIKRTSRRDDSEIAMLLGIL